MNSWIHVTGWALIHFVWQGALVALATAIALRWCRRRSAQVRYAIACIGLTAMLAAVAATAALVPLPGSIVTSGSGIATASQQSEATWGPLRIAKNEMSSANGAIRTMVDVDALLPTVVWGWLAGVTLLLARFAGGCWRIHRLRVASLGSVASPWQSIGERLARRLRVDVAFHMVESRLVDAPIVIGWLRPVVLLPVAALANLTPGQIEALVAHELAHIRRRDYAVNLLQTIAEALLFFHPAVWWISSRIREEREHCCDDAAVDACGEPIAYAEALVELATWRTREAALAVGATHGSLLARIHRLLAAPEADEPRAMSALIVLALSVVVAGAIAMVSPASVLATVGSAAASQAPAGERKVRTTDHFEIHYPSDLDLHAERIAREAERAYEQVSLDLRHHLAFKVPVMVFATTKELEQSVQAGGAAQPHTVSSADRLLIAVDRPADQWPGLITHEVTHVFGFDILPGTSTPLWISEGLAEYQRGTWDPNDLVALRDAVRANAIPKLSALQRAERDSARLVHGLGHAAFEFIESRWGKAGVRQFLLSLRQAAGGGGDPYEAAFRLSRDEFDQAFESYLKERFARTAGQSPAARFDYRASVSVAGDISSIRFPAPSGLACMELWVLSATGTSQGWGVECDGQAGEDLLRALKPGDRVIVTGAPAREAGMRRMVIRGLVRPSDGFTWRSRSG